MRIRTGIIASALVALAGLGTGCGSDEPAGPSTGTLEALLTMEGADQDTNGGTLYLNGVSLGSLSLNVRKTEQVEAGIHVIMVGGISANCTPLGTNERNVTIRAGQTSAVEFKFLCESIGGTDPGGGDPVE